MDDTLLSHTFDWPRLLFSEVCHHLNKADLLPIRRIAKPNLALGNEL